MYTHTNQHTDIPHCLARCSAGPVRLVRGFHDPGSGVGVCDVPQLHTSWKPHLYHVQLAMTFPCVHCHHENGLTMYML